MKDIRTLFRMIHQLYVILDHRQRLKIVFVFFILLIGSGFELLGVSAILPFIQVLITPEELMKEEYIVFLTKLFGINNNSEMILMIGIGIVIIYLIKNAYLIYSSYVQTSYSNNTQKELAVLMFRSYLNHPYAFFLETGSGEILRGVNSDTMGVYNVIANGFKLISECLVVLVIAIYLMMIDILMATGVLIVGVSCMLIIIFVLKRKIASYAQIYQSTGRKRNRWLVQAAAGIKDIKVFNRSEYFIDGFEKESYEYVKSNIKYTFSGTLPERIIEAFCVSGIIISVLLRFIVGIRIEKFVTQMAVFAMGAFRVLPSIARITGYINSMVYNRPMVESTYNNIINARNYMKKIEAATYSEDLSISFQDKIKISDLNWKYPESLNNVLENFNLEIFKGEAVGIIGESGAGKSTFVDMLLRLYEPQHGIIYLDNVNINHIPPQTWANIISYVPQSVFLLDDTVRANVVFGRDKEDDNMVWEALRKASLDEFIQNQPNGLNTIVGERGIKFSGGQRQRIAIARALYMNPQILILDEATSALDNETEGAVMEAVDELAGEMTLIIIAHRVTTLKGCDKIYEINGGKAVERNKDQVIYSALK